MRQQLTGLVVGAICLGLAAGAAASPDLQRGFEHPPDGARPWVYWFPLNGNLTREGITLDLEAMNRVGIGGVLIMEVDQGAPEGRADFAGPLWRSLFKHACSEASRLGLEVNMNNDAGWCGSGGPWITPELAMQKLVWSETRVEGARRFEKALSQPATIAGYYRDIAVLAFPEPADPARIAGIQGKAAFTPLSVSLPATADWPEVAPERTVPRDRVIDLTARLEAGGRLAWDVPEGRWTILRIGHTPTGKGNHPAPAAGYGLECDKLSRRAVETQFAGLMGKLIADVGPLAGRTLVSTHIDSWEVGVQNWTPLFRDEFRQRRGYDLLRFLPVITGRVVESVEISERFLWDLRQTISELLLDNYAGRFRELAHRHGMRLSIEAYHTCPTDEMAYAGRADEPMGEFWSWARYGAAFSCTEMASAAHVYGKRIVGAEAFTASNAERWLGHPGNIKDLGDWAFCEGINRFVFHRYALQPWVDRKPGMSMGPWGLHYERTQTWWEQSIAWHQYLARCQFLLQQGLFVADICLLGPEGSPQSLSGQNAFVSRSPGGAGRPLERPGYNFDTCPPEVVLTRMSVRDGRLVLPDGMSYRILVLPRVATMTPRLLRRIRELVEAGATVVGAPPSKSPSLSDYPRCDAEVKKLAAELWGPDEQDAGGWKEHRSGRGRVIQGGEFSGKTGKDDTRKRLGAARWIWRKEGNPVVAAPAATRYFRRAVEIPPGRRVRSAWLVMTADNSFSCWVNGRKAGSGIDFNRTYVMDIRSLLKPGGNLIAVAATNATDKPNPAGLIASLFVEFESGPPLRLHTDGAWEAAAAAAGDWKSSASPKAGWAPAMELGSLGMAPWGDVEHASSSRDLFPDIEAAARLLAGMGVPPDFAYRSASAEPCLRYIHRALGGTDVYFVANGNPRVEAAVCSFRISGRRPELWWPATGSVERAAVYDEAGGVTRIPLWLDPHGSVFVVFRENAPVQKSRVTRVTRGGKPVLVTDPRTRPPEPPASEPAPSIELTRTAAGGIEALVRQPGAYVLETAARRKLSLDVASVPAPVEIAGPWDVRFAPGGGAPRHVMLEKLISWSEHPEPGVRYFSGTATYRKTFSAPGGLRAANRRWFLDLGDVQVMARVKLNGKDLGILWKPPYRVEITDAARAGDNILEVEVVNLWVNRLIGDENLPEDSDRKPNGTLKAWPRWLQEGKPSPTGRYTFTSWRLWKKNDPLQPSGLLGPVKLVAAESRTVEPGH